MTFASSYELIHLFDYIFNIYRNGNRKKYSCNRFSDVLTSRYKVTSFSIKFSCGLPPGILTHTFMVLIYWSIRVMHDLRIRF